MVQCMGRSKRSESKGRLLTGWWKGTFGLIALLGLLMGVMVAQVKPPEQERLLERRDGRERLFERMQGGRSPNSLFRSPAGSFTSRSRQFSEELVWFKPLLDPGEVVFSPDGQFLASPKRGGGIGIFRVSDGTLVRTLTGHTDVVTSVAFSPDGNLIASGSWDKTIKTWRVSDGSLVRTLTGHTGYVISVAFSPDGILIASGSDDNTIKIWRVSDGTLVRTLTGHIGGVTSVAFSPDGSLIASGNYDSTINIWRVSDGTLVRTLTGHTSGVTSVAFSPDGILIASGSGWPENTIKIWRVSDGSLVRTLTGHTSWVYSVTFSPDGNLIASGSEDKTINIWRVSDGTLVRTLTGHTDRVYSVTFSPDGNLIASGSRDETINIWQVSDGSLVRTLTGHTDEVRSVTFSPDGSLIASGGGDGLALWRVGAPTNRPPSIPTLLSPDDGSTVSPTPTFKVKSEDPDGDDVKFVLELRKGDEVKNFETGFFASGSEATFTVPSDQALSEGQWSWRARAIDSKGAVSDWSGTRTIQVTLVPLIKSGVRLVACPVIGPTDPKSVFAFDDDKWAWYDPTSGYLLYPNSQTNLQVGKGYWAKFVQDTKPNVKGDLPDATKPFSISLKKGWNLIGNPWLVDLVWDLSSIHVKMGGQEKALKDLGENEGVEPYAWRWDGSNYRLVFDRTIITGVDYNLPSWEGAWVYAHTDCELVLPPPSQSKGRGTRGEGRVAKGNGWSMRLQASVNGSVGEVVLGIANGTRGLAVGLPPEPPTGNNGVQVILLKNNTPLAVDVRNDGSRRQEWEVLVRFGTRDGGRGTSERKEVVLTFDGIGYAPKDVSAWLVDTVTGKRLYLRTQPSYRFVAQEGEVERKFKVVVERGNYRPLRVVGLKATPMRGQGVVIEFSLTKPAKVEAEVLTLTGRRVAILDAGSSEGLTRRIVWRGVGIEGQKVGSGVYLVRVRAVDEEGRETQAVTVARMK